MVIALSKSRLNEIKGLKRNEWEYLIDQWIFNERDRMILKRRLLDGICYEPLAEEFGLSTVQVKRIVNKRQNELFENIL